MVPRTRMNEGERRQETASGSKGMAEKNRGEEQADKIRNGNGKNGQRKDNRNTRSNNGEGATENNRADGETKKRLRRLSWNVCRFATEERKRKNSEQVSKRDLEIVGIQESWEKGGGEIGCRVGEYARMRKGQNSKNSGAGGVGFLVKE